MNPSVLLCLDDYSQCKKYLTYLENVLKLTAKETKAIREKMELLPH